MQSDWEIKPITEIIEFNPKYSVKKGSNVNYIEMASVPEYNRKISYFKKREFKSGSKFKNGETLFSRITPCLQNGKTSQVSGLQEDEIANGSTEFIVLSAKDKTIDTDFVYYLSLDKEFRKYAEGRMEGTTGRQRVSWQALSEYKLPIPPKEVRKKIANILSTLDDKIELNRRMNQTLEDMAQTLFKSWFVDFEPVHALANMGNGDLDTVAKELGISKEVLELFPYEFEDSKLGMIPKGWGVERLSQFGEIITGKTPSTKKEENFNGQYPFITIPDMHSHLYIDSSVRTISEIGNKVQPKKLIPKDSLIVSCIATVGLVGINTKDSHTNQQINSIVCEKNYLYYLYNLIKGMKSKLEMLGSAGTTTLNVNKSTFESIEVIKANENILNKFLIIVESSYTKILKNTEEIQTLQKTRDTLLPKLLSGEIEV